MNRKTVNTPIRLALAGLLLLPFLAVAQVPDLDMRLPMDIDADNTTIDGKNSMIIFSGLRLTQGRISIQDVGSGRIRCASAELYFDEFRLRNAIVTGSPAIYDLQRPGTDEVTHAEAGRLDYNVDEGVIRFSEEATITEGGNQISSHVLVYNIAEQRINADSTGEEDGRVRITYTPANGIELPEDALGEDDTEERDESP
jgi:lipopolysaccharide transport protein LptA